MIRTQTLPSSTRKLVRNVFFLTLLLFILSLIIAFTGSGDDEALKLRELAIAENGSLFDQGWFLILTSLLFLSAILFGIDSLARKLPYEKTKQKAKAHK